MELDRSSVCNHAERTKPHFFDTPNKRPTVKQTDERARPDRTDRPLVEREARATKKDAVETVNLDRNRHHKTKRHHKNETVAKKQNRNTLKRNRDTIKRNRHMKTRPLPSNESVTTNTRPPPENKPHQHQKRRRHLKTTSLYLARHSFWKP